MRRRDFFGAASLAAFLGPASTVTTAQTSADYDDLGDGSVIRRDWVNRLVALSTPVLTHLADGTLRTAMPVEGEPDRRAVTHLEAVGRTLAGLAPWLDLPDDGTEEAGTRARLAALAREGLRR